MGIYRNSFLDDVKTTKFVRWLGSRLRRLWRKLWFCAQGSKDVCKKCGGTTLSSPGVPIPNVLICEDCEGEFHLECSGHDTVPSTDFHCGCRGNLTKVSEENSRLDALDREDGYKDDFTGYDSDVSTDVDDDNH